MSFSLDGSTYEIDLSEPHVVALQEALAPFVTAARRRGSAPATATPASPTGEHAPRRDDPPPPSRVPVAAAPFQQPDPAVPARRTPTRAPLVADPFNPTTGPLVG